MSATATRRATQTGGRNATTRHIAPELALAVGMPSTAAPTNWQWSALTKLARMESGHTPSRRHPEYWDGEIPWIGIKDAKVNHGRRIEDTQQKTNELGLANSSARLLPENTVCLSRTASVGYVLVMGCPMATSQDFVNWVCADDLNPEFLKYLFIAEGDGILRFASGAVHQTIYFPEAKAFHICHPEVPEQRRIVGILDEAFAGIATAKATAEKNLQNARALFESHLNAVFTQRGDGWVETTIGEVCTLKSGTSVKNSLEKTTGELPYVKVADMTCEGNEDAVTTSTRFLNKSDTGKNAAFPPGTTIFPKRGGAILTNKKRLTAVPIYADLNIMGVIPSKVLVPKFLYFYLINVDMRELGSGSSIPQINNYDIAPLAISFPKTVGEQTRIVDKLESLSAGTQSLETIYQRKLTALDELKKSLLHQAFSGQL
jgi:type I restriction enzyme S subunit